ncbi:MAG: hypothetical protein ACE1YX_03355 [Nitrosopumilaceae archaeon]
MDSELEEKMEQKITEVIENSDEISQIVKYLDNFSKKYNSFGYGIAIGRLYNSFHYQCRRILKRNPTKEELSEFLEIISKRQNEILEVFKLR